MPRCAGSQIFNDMTVADLKEECRSRGIKVSGVKRDIIERLAKDSKKRKVSTPAAVKLQEPSLATHAPAPAVTAKATDTASRESAVAPVNGQQAAVAMVVEERSVALAVVDQEIVCTGRAVLESLEPLISEVPAAATDGEACKQDLPAAGGSIGVAKTVTPASLASGADAEGNGVQSLALSTEAASSSPRRPELAEKLIVGESMTHDHATRSRSPPSSKGHDKLDAKESVFQLAPMQSLMVAPSPARRRLVQGSSHVSMNPPAAPQNCSTRKITETVAAEVIESLKTSCDLPATVCPGVESSSLRESPARPGIGLLRAESAAERDAFCGGTLTSFEQKPFYEATFGRLQAKARGEAPASPIRKKPSFSQSCSTPQRRPPSFYTETTSGGCEMSPRVPAASPRPSQRVSSAVPMLSPAQFQRVFSPAPYSSGIASSPRSPAPALSSEASIRDKRRHMLEKLTEQMQVCLRKLQVPDIDDGNREKVQDLIRSIKTRMDEVTGLRVPGGSPAPKRAN